MSFQVVTILLYDAYYFTPDTQLHSLSDNRNPYTVNTTNLYTSF